MKGVRIGMGMLLALLTLGMEAGWVADQPQRGPATQGKQATQRTPAAAAEMNRIPVRVPPQTIQGKLKAAMAAVESSDQKLKAAAAALTAYLDREASCAGKTWTAQEMDKGCRPQDTLALCKEKLVAACAAGRGPGKGKLWKNLQDASADLSQKAAAVSSVYGDVPKLPIGGTGIPDTPPLF